MIRRIFHISLTLSLLIAFGCATPSDETPTGSEAESQVEVAGEADAESTPWWQLSDEEFATTYAGDAFSDDVTKQSMVAWMIFARVNQQVSSPFGSGEVSAWETWPTDDDTFSSSEAFAAESKTRETPRFVTSEAELARSESLAAAVEAAPPAEGEEVTRNMLGYDYIRDNGLNTLAGIKSQMQNDFVVDLPLGAIEIKGNWSQGETEGAYTFTGGGGSFSLVGLHIGMKMKATPSDPFTSEDPSWFWTTFEFKDNPLRSDLEPFVTYKDQLRQAQADELLTEAGLGSTNFVNYRSNGTQIRYSDQAHPNIVLGNSTMEAFAAVPQSGPPFTAWNSSCHNCHGQVAMNRADGDIPIFTTETGAITNRTLEDWYPLDFVWGFFKAQ